MGWLGSAPTVFSVVAVYAHNQQYKLVAKEVQNGLVSARSYMLATMALEGPCMVILALCAMIVPLYGIAAGNVSGLVGIICVMTVQLWCFECVAQCVGVVVPHAPAGMLAMLGYWIIAFLFSGSFLKPVFIIWPFRELVYLTPLFYGMRSIQYQEFHDTLWDGAQLTPTGFKCNEPGFCYGREGDQVLGSLSLLFSSVAGNHFAMDVAMLLLMAFIFKVICFATIVLRTYWADLSRTGKTGSISEQEPTLVKTPIASARQDVSV